MSNFLGELLDLSWRDVHWVQIELEMEKTSPQACLQDEEDKIFRNFLDKGRLALSQKSVVEAVRLYAGKNIGALDEVVVSANHCDLKIMVNDEATIINEKSQKITRRVFTWFELNRRLDIGIPPNPRKFIKDLINASSLSSRQKTWAVFISSFATGTLATKDPHILIDGE